MSCRHNGPSFSFFIPDNAARPPLVKQSGTKRGCEGGGEERGRSLTREKAMRMTQQFAGQWGNSQHTEVVKLSSSIHLLRSPTAEVIHEMHTMLAAGHGTAAKCVILIKQSSNNKLIISSCSCSSRCSIYIIVTCTTGQNVNQAYVSLA